MIRHFPFLIVWATLILATQILATQILATQVFLGQAIAQSAQSGQSELLPMTAEEFDAYTKGKTLFYAADGRRYGAEVYLESRRVRWSFLDGNCKDGFWYEDRSRICFVYEDMSDPQCWTFYRAPTGLEARFDDENLGDSLYEIEGNGEELLCLGPDVGV